MKKKSLSFIIIPVSAVLLALNCGALCVKPDNAVNDACAAFSTEYDTVLSAADYTCAADADCACYMPATVESRCGGITGKKSAAELNRIAKKFYDLKCPRPVRCAAWQCVPACINKRCGKK